jgi:hypothetical protein
VHWATEKRNVTEEDAVNLPVTTLWCGMPSRRMLGPFFFEATFTDTANLLMTADSNKRCIDILFSDVALIMIVCQCITTPN